MRNWKELGEVPDSDEEDFDTQESQEQLDQDATTSSLPHSPSPDANKDIWAIPDSSPEVVGQLDPLDSRNDATISQISSAATSIRQLPAENAPGGLVHEHKSSETRDASPETGSLFHTIDMPDSPPQSSVLSSKSLFNESATNHTVPEQNMVNVPTVTVSHDHEIHSDYEQPSPTASIRLSRSLRPRKPIQQHPYMVESAQYNNFMKSHGMKPLRVRDDPLRTARQDETGESQDQDFTGEDSQLSSGNGAVDTLNSSQPLMFDDNLHDIDELALSPSLGTSSPRRRLIMSSQPSNDDQTDRTSIGGDEDFPTLEELGTRKATGSARTLKRQSSPRFSSTRKRQRAQNTSPLKSASAAPLVNGNIWDMSPSPPVFRLPRGTIELSQSPVGISAAKTPRSLHKISSERRMTNQPASPDAGADADGVPDVMLIGSDESSQSSSASDSESEAVRSMARKIRGVLPASWLRLDQKIGRSKTGKARQGKPYEQSPEHAARRGVAQPRQRTPTRDSPSGIPSTNLLFLDDNDDEDSESEHVDSSRRSDHAWDLGFLDFQNHDDKQGEAEEDDWIDRMLPSQKKRTRPVGEHRKSKRRMGPQRLSTEQSSRKPRQQKLTSVLSRNGPNTDFSAAPSLGSKSKKTSVRIGSKSSSRAHQVRATKPPRLSILDVAEPNAPRFIKIAARTARARQTIGKSSPSRKHINLGNRTDNIDALSVLEDWKAGRIKPRLAHTGPHGPLHIKSATHRGPLRQLSLNNASNHSVEHQKRPHLRQATSPKQALLDNFATSDDNTPHRSILREADTQRRPKIISRRQKRDPGPRPAQLETVEETRFSRPDFTTRKRHLDALYRRSHARSDPSTIRRSDEAPQDTLQKSVVTSQGHGNNEKQSMLNKDLPRQKSRFRKQFAPRCRNLEAPQYVHANDPVDPSGFTPEPEPIHDDDEKLVGLNPFGLHYTHHFDIFPLDTGVFFHETTLIGQGVVRQAASSDTFISSLSNQRESLSTDLNGRPIQWGPWNDTTSSEIGLFFDFITERFVTEQQIAPPWQDWDEARAADSILRYILHSVSFTGEMGMESFINRLSELFNGLLDTLETSHSQRTIERARESSSQARTLSSLLIVALLLLRICQSSTSYYSASLGSEQILLRLARFTIRDLVDRGFDEVVKSYEDMQRLAARQRGIRSGDVIFHSWVVVIKCLESAQIPRNGFWDVAYAAMDIAQINTFSDARHFETLWSRIFMLLPLGEFDSAGVLVPYLRQSVPLQGWALPQQLLRRVFHLYRANLRQSPSFNEYCRALVSRCYYLIQQWGWYKCSGIIGVIFDFFGSQNLEHLRNEEVYKSPQFLEDLVRGPSISILPEDRCFHIFLKMLAVVIRHLSSHGLMNDVKNLVARTLPNHNRQYSKEQTIHQHELAALRNHHDLLCTLFWSAPPDLRPPPQLIEKLVAPGSSHKEACLINLRAWNQLARFVVSSGEEAVSYRPFASWQNNVFQQVLEQYLAAEKDIQQQYLALSEDVSRTIGQYVLKSMISQNRAAAMDILHFSVKASLDVLTHSPSLSTAISCFNSSTFNMSRLCAKLTYV